MMEPLPAPNVLPEGYHSYELQIAGHKPTDIGKESLGVLEDRASRQLLKPLQSKGRGEVEKAFYQEVFESHPDLAPHLPRFHGTRRLFVNNKEVEFLVLENLTARFSRPCILDVKMGAQTWHPNAPPEKVRREQSKSEWSQALGWRVLGLKVFDGESRSYIGRGKSYGRTLSPNDVPKMLELYLGRSARSVEVCRALVQRLRLVQSWFQHQRSFQIYSSSLLLIFEGDEEAEVAVDVRMIDFAHIAREPILDTNYIHGLHNFVQDLDAYAHSLSTNSKSV